MRTRGSRSAMKGESFATSVFDRLGQIRQADVANSKGLGSVLSLAREAQLASNERRSKICPSRPFPRTIHTCMCHPTATRIDHRDVCMDTHFDRLAFSVRISLSRRRLGPAAPGTMVTSPDGPRICRVDAEKPSDHGPPRSRPCGLRVQPATHHFHPYDARRAAGLTQPYQRAPDVFLATSSGADSP
jgi:hypothetical protein